MLAASRRAAAHSTDGLVTAAGQSGRWQCDTDRFLSRAASDVAVGQRYCPARLHVHRAAVLRRVPSGEGDANKAETLARHHIEQPTVT